jgi:hypothetical protein
MLGQGVRVITGLNKIHEKAATEGKDFSEVFQTSRFFLSLLIGFVAGALGALVFEDIKVAFDQVHRQQTILTLLGAGYAGTDFIEGFVSKYLPGKRVAPPADTTAPRVAPGDEDNTPPVG